MTCTTYEHNEAQLRAHFKIPAHALLLPLEVDALVVDVHSLAAKRGARPDVVALAGRLRSEGQKA